MEKWTIEYFERVARRSQSLHGNKYVLPVAAVIAEGTQNPVKAPDIGIALNGRLPPNRVLEALDWLVAMSVLEELPYPGRPHARLFERTASAYWNFVPLFCEEDAVSASATRASVNAAPPPDRQQ